MASSEPLEPRRLLAGVTDTLVPAGADWRYLDTGANPPAAWAQPAFDDAAWKTGRAELGYGDGDEATVIAGGPATSHYITTYFRRTFPASEVTRYAALAAEIKRDDGAILYLNGREVARSNMPAGAVTYTTLASTNVAAPAEYAFYAYSLDPALLVNGTNTLAVEIHQAAATSVDVSFDLRLTATRPDATTDTAPFTVVVLPDTQYYSQSYPATFNTQTQWIVDHVQSNNIKFVTHLGDVVQTSTQAIEWQRADAAMDKLDTLPTLPYSVALGNHDYDIKDSHAGPTTQFTQYFGAARYAGRSWYGGSSPDQRDHYQIFSAAGRSFLHITVEFEAPDSALAWAQSVVDAHPNLPAILTTHAYVESAAGRSTTTRNADGNSGEQIWQEFVRKNPQVFMVLNGHYPAEANQTSTDAAGLPVFEMLADYQGRANGGNGWMRLLEFRPADNRVDVKTFSPTLNRFETDANSQFSLPLNFATRFTFTQPPPPPPPPTSQTLTLRQGTNGYASASDTLLRQAADVTGGPDSNLAAAVTLHVDDDTPPGTGADSAALLRFDKLFADAGGPIPLGSTITSAVLTFQVTGSGSGMRLHRMLTPWSDTATWNTLVNGIQTDGVEALATADATVGAGTSAANIGTGALNVDVTASLRAWSAGAANRGWALLPLAGGTDGLSFASSEGATLAQRPTLTVTFTPPAAQAAALAIAIAPAPAERFRPKRSLFAELLITE
jgi:hypothetical protein